MNDATATNYDILVATVDPTDWSVKKMGIYADVNDAVSRHPSEDGLGSWIEGGVCDINFDRLPDYHAIELIHSSTDKMMYLAMRGQRPNEFEKALKEAVEYRKKNPKRLPEELSYDMVLFINCVVDEYVAKSGYADRDVIYGAMTFLLHKLSTGAAPSDGAGYIPPFMLVPDITDKDNAICKEDGQRPYSQAPGDAKIGQYDILLSLVSRICNFKSAGEMVVDFDSPLEVASKLSEYYRDIADTRQTLRKSWEETLREMVQKDLPEGVFTNDEVKALPIKEILIRLMRYSYRKGADTNLIEWAAKIDMAQDLQVFTKELYREAATLESEDPVGDFEKGTDVEEIASAYLKRYLR